MDKTNIKVEFKITGDEFNPDAVTKHLQIEPSQHWKEGEQIKDKNILRKFSCWIFSTEYEESLDINNQIKKLIDVISVKKDELINFRKDHRIDYKIVIVINVENSEKPAIYLTSDIIEFANDIKAEIDFDLYIHS